MVNFTATKVEFTLIHAIAERAVSMAQTHGEDYKMQDALMDIEGCHSNGCPLDLNGLAGAKPSDFSHDVFGINRHLNRETGELENCFVPRYTKKVNHNTPPCTLCGSKDHAGVSCPITERAFDWENSNSNSGMGGSANGSFSG